ncbi:hypothetical protein BU17DRAFT_87218 [Hysterangium stoloniferum]|nr:hypothetical protein BU17DRAFT_87218 [Hysterangium stoloniferum]
MSMHAYTNLSPAKANSASQAILLNNEALQLSELGDNAGAERLHKEALSIKERIHGPDSIQAALTRNALGEVQLKQGKYDEAEENLRKAVAVRSASGHAFDGAVSRENLAQVLEAKGQLKEAKETRDLGRPDKLSCGNYNVAKF